MTVHHFEELWREGDRRGFLVQCGSGTYVRSLVMDLGDAYCDELRRTRSGPFDVADASDRVIPLDEALAFIPAVELDGEEATRAAHGRRVALGETPVDRTGVVRLRDREGLIALAEAVDGEWKPIVGFRG